MMRIRTRRPHQAPLALESGFTLVELLIYMLLTAVIMTAVYQLMIGQGRQYGKQIEGMDANESLRSAAVLLAWDLRQASSAGGDLYSIQPNAIVLRSVQGAGTVCALHATQPLLGLWATTGDIDATALDSALVFSVWGDAWAVTKLKQVTTSASSIGVGACAGTGVAPDLGVEIIIGPSALDSMVSTGIVVGAPFRAFRRVEYGLYVADGRTWLGRKVGGAASYEKLTGPLKATDGLAFRYYDKAGNLTADPLRVSVVEFILQAESFGRARGGSGTLDYQRGNLVTKVALRG